jgi:RNA polymerase sigma factor (sigma-70 family)
LLQRFVGQRDEAAFAAVVRRHGPMVLRVAFRTLQNEHDAEDVFQATFLVLSQKAHTVRRRDSLGSWLYGITYRLALKTKATAGERRNREQRVAATTVATPLAQITVQEAQTILDEELNRLPARFREPVVLCCLEGLARDEAAQRIGCPISVLKSRLEQARERLRQRLLARGLSLPCGLGAFLLLEGAAGATVRPSLIGSTTKAAITVAAGKAASAAVTAKVAALTEGVLRTMFLTKIKIATVALVVGMMALGGGMLTYRTLAAEGASPLPVEQKERQKPMGIAAIAEMQEPLAGKDLQAVNPTDKNQPKPASERLYELHFQVLLGVIEIKRFTMTLPMNVSGQVRIIEGGVVPDAFNRDQLGVFLRAKVVGENVKGVLTELALDDIGLVDGKADIKRLYSGKQFGKLQGFSYDSKALPGQLTINVTVQRLSAPSAAKDNLLPPGTEGGDKVGAPDDPTSTKPKSGREGATNDNPGGGAQDSGEGDANGHSNRTGKPIGSIPSDARDHAPMYVLQVQVIQEGLERTAADKTDKLPTEPVPGPGVSPRAKAADKADIAPGASRIYRDARDIRTLQMTLPLAVPGKAQIIPGGAVLGDTKREFLGVFLKATVLEEKAKNVKIELTLDDIGLVDGKADIQRLFSTKQCGPLGEVQECSVNPKTAPGRLTIRVTVQRLAK